MCDIEPLTISTCMAPNMDFLCQDLAGYLSERLDIPVALKIDVPWQERERLLDAGKIDLCWICGLPYIWKADRAPGKIIPLVAPVMSADRYQNRPIYYSDVVVLRDSPYTRLVDLRGASWAYNEPGSHSGYGVVRYALATREESLGFFSRLIESGSHQNSLQMILRGKVDASAIDSTVLELELEQNPSLASQIRVIDTFGPSPIPPWVASGQLDRGLKSAFIELLIQMDRDPRGQKILEKARMSRFVPVNDRDYDPIREMARIVFKDPI